MLALVKLDFCFIFVDEFTVNNHTHCNYQWVKTGYNTGVPVAKTWQSFSCIAAVSKTSLVQIQVSKKRTNSDVFCDFIEELAKSVRSSTDINSRKVILFLDNARYHSSKKTLAKFKELSTCALFNAPENPDFNACELFINALKQRLRRLRGLGL